MDQPVTLESVSKMLESLIEGQKTLATKVEITSLSDKLDTHIVNTRRELDTQSSSIHTFHGVLTETVSRVDELENKVEELTASVDTLRAEMNTTVQASVEQLWQNVWPEVQKEIQRVVEVEVGKRASSKTGGSQKKSEPDRLKQHDGNFDASAPNFRTRKESLLALTPTFHRGSYKPWDIWGSNFSNSNVSPSHHI